MTKRLRFKRTAHGIKPTPIGCFVSYVGLLANRELLGEVRDYYSDDADMTRLKVRHFNGEPWPLDPLLAQVDIIL
jgi:hypothetical protein